MAGHLLKTRLKKTYINYARPIYVSLLIYRGIINLAEGMGFEPMTGLTPCNRLAGGRTRPTMRSLH